MTEAERDDERRVEWFELPGPENTDAVIRCVSRRLSEGDLHHVVVASGTGETAAQLMAYIDEFDAQIICVTHHAGFSGDDEVELERAYVSQLRKGGASILTATHALSGVGRSISKTFGGVTPVELIAAVLRLFGQGTKVCVEIAVMAADSGLVPTDQDILCIGGTGRGADTALVLRPSHMDRFFDLRIREELCRPVRDRQESA